MERIVIIASFVLPLGGGYHRDNRCGLGGVHIALDLSIAAAPRFTLWELPIEATATIEHCSIPQSRG
jgi:hypothetical protein